MKLCKLSEEISLPGFRVIYCYTRRLVSVSIGSSYMALSYVWGDASSSLQVANEQLPTCAGNVIEDSIIVVKKLIFDTCRSIGTALHKMGRKSTVKFRPEI